MCAREEENRCGDWPLREKAEGSVLALALRQDVGAIKPLDSQRSRWSQIAGAYVRFRLGMSQNAPFVCDI